MNCDNQPPLTEHLGGAPHREIRNPVLGCKVTFSRQPGTWMQLSCGDARSDVVGEGGIDQLRPLWVKVRNFVLTAHVATVSMLDLRKPSMSYT